MRLQDAFRPHTHRTYKCSCVCICIECMCNWLCVSLSPGQRECAGFNKRVGVARHHPIITVIVDRSGASLCAAGNHGGQDPTFRAPHPANTAYYNTRLKHFA